MDTTETLGFWGSESEEVIARQFPLHKACRDGDVIALSRLVAQATPHQLVAEDQFYGWSPLHWAAYFGKTQCLNGLLRTGVNVNIRTSRFLQTPSHISAFGGHPSCLLELLKAGADFHAKDYLGELPIHKAARVGNTRCVITLIENGANPSIHNNNGHTAADLSRMQNFKECTSLLETACRVLAEREKFQMNGNHQITNGSSGSHLTNNHSNGFTNGNGHQNGHSNGNRKRSYDDESIPNFKRPRTTDDISTMKQLVNLNGLHHMNNEKNLIENSCEDQPMMDSNFNNDVYTRAPSPGMELRENSNDYDLQLWGYMQGYGDTAECLPDDYLPNQTTSNDKEYCKSLHGVKSQGWS